MRSCLITFSPSCYVRCIRLFHKIITVAAFGEGYGCFYCLFIKSVHFIYLRSQINAKFLKMKIKFYHKRYFL
ncbi:hypothetical protein KsCSTR_14980 [Candidatus Kuenenia stuttgartiensis]|uniref:Uncharacterized protein n=1 Tax=Kuenenia stuttgartiensis TaxID=174633 RepID=Q1Q1H4_KUEST|nr:hypothetical protein KsCSTR_14980 [Candidatus Kuenenia stuttgartiensis]CAJ73852.1 unknown protein [Candidatus Kuenenia stuttgartiensis]